MSHSNYINLFFLKKLGTCITLLSGPYIRKKSFLKSVWYFFKSIRMSTKNVIVAIIFRFASIYDSQCFHDIEISQLTCTASRCDWFLYDGSICHKFIDSCSSVNLSSVSYKLLTCNFMTFHLFFINKWQKKYIMLNVRTSGFWSFVQEYPIFIYFSILHKFDSLAYL